MDKYTHLPTSFVGKSGASTPGRFYIRQARADGSGYTNRLTVWPSVDDYNHRNPVPLTFCDAADAVADFDHEVKVYSESLTTTPPPYEPDRDETDFGLTPKRNLWRNRFQQAGEGRPYAA